MFKLKLTLKSWLYLMNKPLPKRGKGCHTHDHFWEIINNFKSPSSPWDKFFYDESELEEEL